MFRSLFVAALLACSAFMSAAVIGTNIPALPLTADRINALPAAEQPAWHRYLAQSRTLFAIDRATLADEMKAAGLTALAARLATSELETNSFCAVAAVGFDRRVIAPPPGRMCLGDTCALIPPFTGNGMAMAFQSAETALPPLLAYARGTAAWSDTSEVISRALRRRFRLRLASAAAVHPFLFSPPRQRVLSALNRVRLVPLAPLYAVLH